jgi:hypothetical protein
MAIFRTLAAAEEFVKEDPFILEGLVKSFAIRDWKDELLPELKLSFKIVQFYPDPGANIIIGIPSLLIFDLK